jgi:serine phosphatase RsbU (regulator of sigma subunit)
MDLTLQGVIQGNSRSWKLQPGKYRLGRATHNELLLTDPSVSRAHAEIVVQDDSLEINDLGSRNGTWINERPVQGSTALHPGDKIRLGNVELLLRDADSVLSSGVPSEAIFSDAEHHGTVHLPWEQVKSEFSTESRMDRSLFQVVTEAGHLLVQQQPIEELFDTVLELVDRLIKTRRILLLLNDEAESIPVVRAARPQESHSDEKLMLSRTLMETVIDTKDSLLVTDAQADPRFGEQASIVAMDIRSALVAPLFDNEQVIGLIYADTSDPTVRYDLDHLRVFTMLANLIAVKITNTKLLDDQRAKERMEQEMATAARIQRVLLPSDLPDVVDYEILAHQVPCFETAGDLYDAERLDDGSICLTVGDVSGKGIGSALLMSHIIASLRVLYGEALDPATLVQRLHRHVLNSSDSSHYATLFFGRLDPGNHRIEYVNAGHNPPMLLSSAGTLQTLDPTGQPVGLLPDSTFEIAEAEIEAGSLLCIFSDGITEAGTIDEFYGEERLLACLKRNLDKPLEEIASCIFQDLDEFQGSTPQNDDITLFLIRRRT